MRTLATAAWLTLFVFVASLFVEVRRIHEHLHEIDLSHHTEGRDDG